ncbi:hypothetical protein [Nocardia sp. NPDC052566]|uniref:hypothetical protein n=1 Tax=Nocardia sp. NPDC052566 TaxID=3364330 RepID=UPI0037C5C1E1
MLLYTCLNVWCLDSRHDTPLCPYKPPSQLGSMTPAELTTVGHLHRLNAAGAFDRGPLLPRITVNRRRARVKRTSADPWRPLLVFCLVITLIVVGLTSLL